MSDERNVTVNREHKDRLFNFIFGSEENREWTLSLYNAVNESDYTDPSLITFNTLEDVLYLDMRNDTSFLISDIMSVYEHQSSFNPNMPLRLLGYVEKLYSGYISRNKLNKYGEKLIKLPVPKLIVFYNGATDKDDEVILKLTDSFEESVREYSDIEVRVRMLNVNYGRNKKLMDRCKPLAEYSWFIEEIRHNQKQYDIAAAVKRAIETMSDEFSIKSFLIVHKKEVEGMLDTEYNEEEVRQLFINDGIEIGMERGRKEGKEEGKDETIVIQICKKLLKGKDPATIADEIEEPVERVMKICDIARKYLPDYDPRKIMDELK